MHLRADGTQKEFEDLCDAAIESSDKHRDKHHISFLKRSIRISGIDWINLSGPDALDVLKEIHWVIQDLGVIAWDILMDVGYNPTICCFQKTIHSRTEFHEGEHVKRVYMDIAPIQHFPCLLTVFVNEKRSPTQEMKAFMCFESILKRFPEKSEDDCRDVALCFMAERRWMKIADLLLDYGADPNYFKQEIRRSSFFMLFDWVCGVPEFHPILDKCVAKGAFDIYESRYMLRQMNNVRHDEEISDVTLAKYYYLVRIGGDYKIFTDTLFRICGPVRAMDVMYRLILSGGIFINLIDLYWPPEKCVDPSVKKKLDDVHMLVLNKNPIPIPADVFIHYLIPYL